ncbi:cupin [Cytobacillus firmus]|uniref:cupin n=1 Tax=Cytobacillus firmus TaxID=1399 RepID=UPI0018CD5965|nr:cupin [Cytobacillus firmus]MBG9448072.1 cupin [Cytobacillus firmus]
MEFFRFDLDVSREISQFSSHNASISPIIRNRTATVGCIHLKDNSVLGMHPAACPQLFLIVDGDGWVKTAGGEQVAVQKGTAVYWSEGEEHESGSYLGMTAIVIEGPDLDPHKYLKPLE